MVLYTSTNYTIDDGTTTGTVWYDISYGSSSYTIKETIKETRRDVLPIVTVANVLPGFPEEPPPKRTFWEPTESRRWLKALETQKVRQRMQRILSHSPQEHLARDSIFKY
jgi:hypothetical protein